MAAEISSVKRRKPPGFMNLLSSAAYEWFLIFLLFVDAALSYLLTKFAEYCELKTPCLLCSRLDRVLGETKPGCYWGLLCSNHREELSSLVPCPVHGKLAEGNGMCEECFMPIVMQNKSGSESYRLLIGKLWVDADHSVLQNLMLNKQIQFGFSGRRTCSCCSKTWRAKSNAERLLGLTPVGYGASKANVKPPLPRVPGRSRFSRRDSLKRLRDKFTTPVSQHSAVSSSTSADTLAHVGYTKLKISSDTESEFPFSEDDDDGNVVSHGKNEGASDSLGACNADTEKETRQGFEAKPSNPDLPNLLDFSDDKTVSTSPVDAFIEHGLRELNWTEACHKPTQLTTELIPLADDPQPLDAGITGSSCVYAETSKSNVSLPHASTLATQSEISIQDITPRPSPNTMTSDQNKYLNDDETKEIARIQTVVIPSSDGTCSSDANSISRSNCLDTRTDNTESPSSNLDKPVDAFDSTTSGEGNTNNSLVMSSKNASPRVHDNKQSEFRAEKDLSSQEIPASEPVEKNDSSYHEYLDGTSDGDIEGESVLDRLKRQVEYDQSCMNSLYKELEEERNAAAIAANEAMAMITRLQEEKASLHMEALQYLRMMEEQAEYDMEALERANDLISEKDKELQDFEAEIEFYRNNFVDAVVPAVIVHDENTPHASSDSKSLDNGNCKPDMNRLASGFEDEKLYITQSLKKLEKKFRQTYCSKNIEDKPNGLNSENGKKPPSKEALMNQETGEDSSFVVNATPASNGTTPENDFVSEKKERVLENDGEINPSCIEKEIAELHERLEALETDRDFLKHVSNLFSNGKDGFHVIQDIALQLQELRKVEFNKR